MKPSEFISFLHETKVQVHHLHHITSSYSTHVALGSFYEAWDDYLDDLIEKFQGKYGNVTGDFKLSFSSELSPIPFISSVKRKLMDAPINKSEDVDLDNVIADMIGLCNKTIYLLKLN